MVGQEAGGREGGREGGMGWDGMGWDGMGGMEKEELNSILQRSQIRYQIMYLSYSMS